MAPAAVHPVEPSITTNPWLRVVGAHGTARSVLADAAPILAQRGFYASLPPAATDSEHDYAQLDPALARMEEGPDASEPAPGSGYAGFTPAQRFAYVRWLAAPHHAAPVAFQQIYLAWLETWLLDSLAKAQRTDVEEVVLELRRLGAWPHWQRNGQYGRTLLLALRLAADTSALSEWIARDAPRSLFGVGLGLLAEAGGQLTPSMLSRLAQGAGAPLLDTATANLRLGSLQMTLGAEPLAWALDRAGAPEPSLWRCAHRDLRLFAVQRDLLPLLEPAVAELLLGELPAVGDGAAPASEPVLAAEAEAEPDRHAWQMVVEFGHSRSEYFDFALRRAQKMPGFVTLLDENRHIVYRVTYRRSEMRRFWPLWEYIQSWAGVKVYLNGDEVERWKIWPYSQYIQ